MRYQLKVSVLSCSTSASSVSRIASQYVREILSALVDSVSYTDIAEHPCFRVNDRKIDGVDAGYTQLYEQVAANDAVLICYPIYCYTVASTAKAITEILGPALARKPVATVVAAGSLRSHLACGDLMLSMMFEQETLCFPRSVLVTRDDIDGSGLCQQINDRLENLCRDFCDFSIRLKGFR